MVCLFVSASMIHSIHSLARNSNPAQLNFSRHTHHTTNRPNLVLGSGSRELEHYTTASEASVHLGVGVDPVVDGVLLLLVEHDLQDLATVLLGAQALADDLDGEDEVGQDGVVHGGQGSRAGTLLCLRCARPVRALRPGQDAARGQDQDVAVGELLLELTGEAGREDRALACCLCVLGWRRD